MVDVNFLKKQAAFITIFFTIFLAMIALSPFSVSAQKAPLNSSISASNYSCEENWTCSDWSGCSSGLSSRVCIDGNKCGTEFDKPSENQSCATVTGVVNLTILRPPEICGDAKCNNNETCMSCPEDCGICSPAQSLAGLMTGAADTSASRMVAAFAIIAFLFTMTFKVIPKKKGF
jgi:hypothetical protein